MGGDLRAAQEIIKLGKREVNSRAYVGAFNFKGGDQQPKVGNLSGGQRNRVHLAKMLKTGANVLLLDEPTNDLDTETLSGARGGAGGITPAARSSSATTAWSSTAWPRTSSAFEGDSHVEWFEGNFADYEEDKKRRLGEDLGDAEADQVQAVRAGVRSEGGGRDRPHHDRTPRPPAAGAGGHSCRSARLRPTRGWRCGRRASSTPIRPTEPSASCGARWPLTRPSAVAACDDAGRMGRSSG